MSVIGGFSNYKISVPMTICHVVQYSSIDHAAVPLWFVIFAWHQSFCGTWYCVCVSVHYLYSTASLQHCISLHMHMDISHVPSCVYLLRQ